MGRESERERKGERAPVTACFIDWQKVSGNVKRAKLMQILKETGID
jgi:hypothetical protein